MSRLKGVFWIILCLVFLQILGAGVEAGVVSDRQEQLAEIFEAARGEFFTTLDKLIKIHPRRAELSGDDMIRLLDARNQIPNLFERLMIIAYQKEQPTYSKWIEKGDEESIAAFREEFVALAQDYAARFVGSLFRRTTLYAFSISLPHNKGKSRLDLVLQSLGYYARSGLPDVPKEQRFKNEIEAEYTAQWAIDAVNARKAQQISKGAGVIVAVLDSGLDPYNSLFKDKSVRGFSFLERTTPPWQEEQHPPADWGAHGTLTASMVLMIAPDCRIMPVRVLDGDTQNDPVYDYWLHESMAAGFYFAVNHGAHIIQIGAALRSDEPVIVDAVRYAYHNNVVVCTSAGNIPRYHFGVSTREVMYRSFDNEVILVGGLVKNDQGIRSWPHTVPGPTMDIATPCNAFMVMPAYIENLENGYGTGTSLASPVASGTVALMRSAAPPAADILKNKGAYCRLVTRCLRKTARLDILGLVEPNEVVGHGLIDAQAAIQMIQAELSTN